MKRLSFLTLAVCLLFAVGAFAETAGVVSATDGADAQRAYWEKVLKYADVFPGATVEDFLYQEPGEGQALMSPQYIAWVQVFTFPINESPYAVGVAYNKDASSDERYQVSTGISPDQYIRFYSSAGSQTRTCTQPSSSGWGMRDLAWDESRSEIHGAANAYRRRLIILDNCRSQCNNYLTQFSYQYGSAHHDGGSSPDTIWSHYWYTNWGAYSISRPSCTMTWQGYLINNPGGAQYGIAIDRTGTFGESWVLWVSYQSGTGGNRLHALKRNGSTIGYQSLPGTAGGIDFVDDWEGTGAPAIIYMSQESPDRVRVYQPPPDNDVAVDGILKPSDGFLFSAGDDVEIEARVGNRGTQPQSDFDVRAIIMDGATEVYNEVVTVASLASGATIDVTFPDFTIAAAEVAYDLEICTELAGDEQPGNDCKSKTIMAVEECDVYRCDDRSSITNAQYWIGGYYWGNAYTPAGYPAKIKYIGAKVCSPGGPFWPWPNANLDPFELAVFLKPTATPDPTPVRQMIVVDDGLAPFGEVYGIVSPPLEITSGAIVAAMTLPNYPVELTGVYCDAVFNCSGNRFYRTSTGFWYQYTSSIGDWYIWACIETPPPIEWMDDTLEADVGCDVVGAGGEVAFDTDVMCNGDVSDIDFRSTDLVNASGDKIPRTAVSFDPAAFASLEPGDVRTIAVTVSIAIAQPAGDYEGELIVEGIAAPGPVSDELPVTIHVEECCDLDVDDDYANLTANKMTLVAVESKKSVISVTMGEFVVLSTNDKFTNVDMDDGPGNVGFSFTCSSTDLSTYFDNRREIPGSAVTFTPDPGALASGEAMRVVLTATLPDKLHRMRHDEEQWVYRGTVTVTADCEDEDDFTLNVNIVKGQAGTVLPNTFVGELDERGLLLAWGEYSFGKSFNLYRENEPGEYVLLNRNPMPGSSSYLDENIVEGGTYAYKFGVIDENGKETVFGPMTAAITRRPTSVSLMPGVPNPMNSETVIRYTITNESEVSLKVYDVTGSVVKTLVNESVPAGYHSAVWNGTNDAGNKVASGVYFYRLTAGDFNQSRKLVVLR
ncbi:T9SS type A sorting domain-containing protein [candidate division TA06 bacterium]|uniref:T9SS type A sorting domain-containing protein n=1 Tax=candidate division TA06 bacterium TaxID=2250710 RepID=A0A523URY3_UNCT6|nr:MAG: T9SS type A sorting domain-containing protein [candidate division TA06 bacterium]